MEIKKIAIGNEKEAFIEKNITSGFNIISSDDNNRGKTILIQSMMFALGNEPAFPTSLEYLKYYHLVSFEQDNKEYTICRKGNNFVLLSENKLNFFDGESELKRYWTKNVFKLPVIFKNELERIVDMSLYFEMFFVGQDKKNIYNISDRGYYNKNDFINMLFSIKGYSGNIIDPIEVDEYKKKIKELKERKNLIINENKILKSTSNSNQYLSAIGDKIAFEKKDKKVQNINSKIIELRKQRNQFMTRKAHWESTIKELKSLNRSIDFGELRCMDCQSSNIEFVTAQKNGYAFDVSTIKMREEIIESIEDKINGFIEELEVISKKINFQQELLTEIIDDEDISLENIVMIKKEYLDSKEAEKTILSIDEEINKYQTAINSSNKKFKNDKEKQDELLSKIISEMNDIYKAVDKDGNLIFDDLFTKKNEIYSGSESTVFHLSRLFSYAKIMDHDCPIVVDSFRAEDLSTEKEERVLNIFKKLENQIIFTTTLKSQELGKYNNYSFINNIDYSSHDPSKMLNEKDVDEFMKMLKKLKINI